MTAFTDSHRCLWSVICLTANRTTMHYVGWVEGRVKDDKSSLCCATSSGFFSINDLFPHLRIFLQYKTGQNINTNFT